MLSSGTVACHCLFLYEQVYVSYMYMYMYMYSTCTSLYRLTPGLCGSTGYMYMYIWRLFTTCRLPPGGIENSRGDISSVAS